MTKASVCQTTQSAPFLPSYSITLPHTHTHRKHTQTHTERHTQRDTHPHTQCCCMLANVSTYMHTQCLVSAHLRVGPPASALYLSKTLVAWAVYVQGPPHLLANLLTHPTKSSYVYSQKPWDCPLPSFGLGHLLEHVNLGFDPPDILSQCNGFSVQPTVLLTHSLAKPMHSTSAPIFKYLVEVLECPCTLKYMPSMVCLVPVIELLGQQYTKWC